MPTKNNTDNNSDSKSPVRSKAITRSLSGIVVSSKMNKTIVVSVEHVHKHPRYGKRTILSEKFKAHDEHNQCKEGDKVTIVECRPISKEKKWRVLGSKRSDSKK